MNMLRRITVGLTSLISLLAVVVGVPWLLLTVGHNPLAGGIPTWSEILNTLTTRDNGTFILGLFTIVAWVGWVILVGAVILEVASLLRNAPAPQIPGFRLPQLAAKQLVGGVLLLFIAGPALAQAAPTHTTELSTTTTATVSAETAEDPAASVNTVMVKKGDSLSRIAREHLGDGDRWPELYEASKDTDQGHGAHITNPNLIYPGWTITLPSVQASQPATTSPNEAVTPPADETAPESAPPEVTEPVTVEADGRAELPSGTAQASPPAPVATSSTPIESISVQDQVQQESDEDPIPVRTTFGVGALLAAGVITLLGRRRQLQQHRRPLGAHIALPTGDEAATEQSVRAVADPLALEDIDQALRCLSRDCAAEGNALPQIRAARLTESQLELYLAEPQQLPDPWQSTADETVWFFESDAMERLDEADLEGIVAPYPALVTLGQDAEDGHVLVDLEYLGVLGLTGDPEAAREVVAAIAIELAVSRWADDITVTLVGAYSEMEDSLRTGRIQYLPSVERLLDTLERRADEDRQALAAQGAPSLQVARVTGAAPDAWIPEIVIITGGLTTRQQNRIANLVDETPRLAVAFITTHGESLSDWSLDLQNATTGILHPVGLTITPQRVTHEAYERILSVVRLTQDTEGTTMTPAEVEDVAEVEDAAIPAAALDSVRTPAVSITVDPAPTHPFLRLLGPVELESAQGSVDPPRMGRLTEYLAFLLLNPGATYPAIDEAMWPGRSADRDANNHNTRGTATSRLRRWLGKNAQDEDYFPPYSNYRISPEVQTDWHQFTDLVGDIASASTENLERALDLVRGRPFKGVPVRRYAWAEMIRHRMVAAISDASYELGHRRLFASNWAGVEEAVSTGIEVDPGAERLWRLRILAAHQGGNQAAFQEAVERVETFSEELGIGLDPETEELLQALENAAPFEQLLMNLEAQHAIERTR